ncbi:MAG TPA: CHAD domain-containing protein [Planctomycetota bacterium]|nr:CHAD domain-containing protein [Planctomycetota bacterium]
MRTTAARSSRIATLHRHVRRLESELRRVRKDVADVEAVHDARVAARRLLAAGELWAFGAAGWPSLRDRLPRFVRRLGRLRNLDVALAFLAQGPAKDRAARKALARALRRMRKRRRRRVLDWLEASRVRRLVRLADDVTAEIRRQPLGAMPGPSDLAAYFARIHALSSGIAWTADPDRAHEIRREIRRLRYAHETLAWAYPRADHARAARALRTVQDSAGEWQDREVVARLADRALRKGRVDVPLTPLLARLQSESRSLVHAFAEALERLEAVRPTMLEEDR